MEEGFDDEDEVEDEVEEGFDDEDEVGDEVGDEVEDEVEDEVGDEVEDDVEDEVEDDVEDEVEDDVEDEVDDAYHDAVGEFPAESNSAEKECNKEKPCFVIFVNDQPVFYANSHILARSKMKNLANQLSLGYVDYNSYIEEVTPDEIRVVGHYRFYLISHTRILERLRVQKVPTFVEYSYSGLAKTLLMSAYN